MTKVGDDELDQLRRNLTRALAKEEEMISNINNLENSLKTAQFNDLRNQNMTVNYDRAIAHVHNVQSTKKSSKTSKFAENIVAGHILELDYLLSGVEFGAQKVHVSPNDTRYLLNVASRKVDFFLQFLWLEQTKSLKHTKVDFPLPIHKAELASVTQTLARQNNVHKIIMLVTEYSEVFDLREEILRALERKFQPLFKYKISDDLGYDFEISDQSNGKKYFEANWTITFYKNKNKMDHSFNFVIDDEADALSDSQKEIFEMLTKGSDDSGERLNIPKLIRLLIRGFSDWQLK